MSQVSSSRLQSIDIVRGLAIVLMALDHVRAYWSPTAFLPVDLEHTDPSLFFTRWITHFCAPVFIFLSGTSAFLQQTKNPDKMALSRFLLSRGLWLIALELVVITASWTASVSGQFMILQVIWAIGISMLVLAAMIHLPPWLILLLSLAMVLGHDLLNGIHSESPLWLLLHQKGGFTLYNQLWVEVIYPIIPWPGVMALGYLAGQLYTHPPQQRIRRLTQLGLCLLSGFVLLRATGIYGDPHPFEPQQSLMFNLMAFVNVSKYPPSLLYLCLTLGIASLILALSERIRLPGSDFLRTFGKVPMFFYLLHIPLINLTAHLWTRLSFGEATNMGLGPRAIFPQGYEPSLWRAYLVWGLFLVVFFPLCARYYRFKQARPHQWWWRYL